MYKVGILGTENSHALAFTRLINGENSAYPDFKVTALYALEKAPSEAIVKEFPSIEIVESPEEMVSMVDCAMITSRHGKYHMPFAMPFIEAGKPVFVDKPFAICPEEAKTMLAAAKAKGVPVTGGSGCKYSLELLAFKEEIESGKIGAVKNAVMSFPAELTSEYGGFYFYGAHLADMVTAVFGCDYKSVTAFVKNGFLSAVVRYDALDVYLSFAKQNIAVAFGEKGQVVKPVTTANIYNYEVDHFTEMVRTGKSPLTDAQLLRPIELLSAIEKSINTGAAVAL